MVTWSWNKRYFERLSERLVLLFLLRVQLEGFHKQQYWMSKCSAWLAESKQTSFTKIIAPNLLNMTYLFSFSCHLLWLFFSAQKKLRSDFILTNNLTSFWLALSNRGHNLDLADKKRKLMLILSDAGLFCYYGHRCFFFLFLSFAFPWSQSTRVNSYLAQLRNSEYSTLLFTS